MLYDLIPNLPNDIIELIWSFVSPTCKIFTSKTNYLKYNYLIDDLIIDGRIENYVRYMIINENRFVVKQIIERRFSHWLNMTNYPYQNQTFIDYVAFLKYYCYKNKLYISLFLINDKIELTGLKEKRSKNNILKNNKWNK